MRQVLKSGEVYHYFANKIQPAGRCSNTSFAYPRAYSYNAVIGKHFAQGVALSDVTWSVTTTRHQSDLRQACRHLHCIYVPSPDSVEDSYRQVTIEVANLMRKASVAKARREAYIGDALRKIEYFNTFALWNDSKLHIDPPVTDPEALKAIAVAVKAETARVNAVRKERERQNALAVADKIAEWRTGAAIYLPYSDAVILRVKGDQIETNKGARIPVSDTPRIWAMVCRRREWSPRDAIGAYQLTKIRGDGSIVVGCHDIPYVEIERIAVQLGYDVPILENAA